jgi:hypothetical protein
VKTRPAEVGVDGGRNVSITSIGVPASSWRRDSVKEWMAAFVAVHGSGDKREGEPRPDVDDRRAIRSA